MKKLLVLMTSLALVGFGCAAASPTPSPAKNEDIQPAAVQVSVAELVNELLPPDEWRNVSQSMKLENGNYWILTDQIPNQGEPPIVNPCANEKNYCPYESWLVNPEAGTAKLVSSMNGYLAEIDVSATPQSDGLLRVEWTMSGSYFPYTRTELVNINDGTLQPQMMSAEEFEASYGACLTNDKISDAQRNLWGISTVNAAACQQEDKSWLVVVEQDEEQGLYIVKHFSADGILQQESMQKMFCGGPIALPFLSLSNGQLTCARVSAGCGGSKTWSLSYGREDILLYLTSESELCVE